MAKNLIDMKITKAEQKARQDKYKISSPMMDGEAYHYDLKLRLQDESLAKLGIDSLPKVGKKVNVICECVVTETSENASTTGGKDQKNRRMELQIQKIALDIDKGSAKDAIDEALEQLK